MVFCGDSNPGKKNSKDIEKQLSSWNKQYKKAIKILLLGAGESGKTTIIKQLKIIHINGFSDEEKKERGDDIRSNILESMATLIENMDLMNIPIGSTDNKEAADFMRNITKDLMNTIAIGGTDTKRAADFMRKVTKENFTFTQEFYNNVEKLWKDSGVQETYSRQNEFQLIDCAKYFLDKVNEVKQQDYEPSVQDILHSRRQTIGIQKIEFDVKIPKNNGGGILSFWVFDVGGQRGERKKWIQVFDGIQAVLFLVASSSFDSVIEEDGVTNRVQEGVDIFKSVWSSRFLKESGFIVFLNKQDILREKIVNQRRSLGKYFPEFLNYDLKSKDRVADEDEEYLRARCFIRDKFMEIAAQPIQWEGKKVTPGMPALPNDKKRDDCYCHFTTATDSNNVKLVFEDVHSMIIMWNLQAIGVGDIS